MRDYEYLFTKALHEKLREKIIGRIFCKVNRDDELYIKIECDDIKYEVIFERFSARILNGFSTEYAAYEVINRYKKFINRKYFK